MLPNLTETEDGVVPGRGRSLSRHDPAAATTELPHPGHRATPAGSIVLLLLCTVFPFGLAFLIRELRQVSPACDCDANLFFSFYYYFLMIR